MPLRRGQRWQEARVDADGADGAGDGVVALGGDDDSRAIDGVSGGASRYSTIWLMWR